MQEDKIIRRKVLVRYLAVTVFCLLVSLIYGLFSHGIRSFWMNWLALWPLVLGARALQVWVLGSAQWQPGNSSFLQFPAL